MTPAADDLLRARWDGLVLPLGTDPAASARAFADLTSRYADPARHYHTLTHVANLLDTLDDFGEAASTPALRLAVWYHDAVYDTHADDNEEQSAAYAAAALGGLGVPAPVIAETGRLILLTKTHEVRADEAAGKLLLDADLAVLGAPPAEYDAYAAAIRREYGWVPDAAYRAGRRRVLENFLRRPRIYVSGAIANRYEGPARQNLQRELAGLG
jgi:predicted metal-dependent HD superfamily phosphohydrolase